MAIEFDTYTKEEVLEMIFAHWQPEQKTEVVALEEALGRIAAENIYSKINNPVHRASKLDGYAVHSEDFANGLPDTTNWKQGVDYVRADTGDDFDDAFDAVIKVEEVTVDADGVLHFSENVNVKPGSMINTKGARMKEGDILHERGTVLRYFDLSTLASGGITEVPVVVRPRVAFAPTGSELIPAGQTPKRGEIIDSNSVLARFYIESLGATPIILPIVKDDPKELEATLDTALTSADIVIINGGSSKGLEDFNTRLLASRGELLCHGVAAAPGRPLSATIIDGKPVINAPGPESALFYVFEWCSSALVARAVGVPARKRTRVKAVLAEEFKRGAGAGDGKEAGALKPNDAPKDKSDLSPADNEKASKPKIVLLRKVKVIRTENAYEAYPISHKGEAGINWKGYSTGQIIAAPSPDEVKGSIVEVELLSSEEYL
jgi:molybdopterin molybdotransferase/putative molybdopterin biosynthesis protein